MPDIRLAHATDFDGWREAARSLAATGVPPHAVAWRVGDEQPGLFEVPPPAGTETAELRVPLRFLLLAKQIALHADPGRWALLYRLLWRLVHGERHLLDLASDADVARAQGMVRAVRRAAHKMKAFLRFKEVWTSTGPRYVAWFEPEHHVLEACASFFTRRFTGMRWVVVTPYRTAAWDGADPHLRPRRRSAPRCRPRTRWMRTGGPITPRVFNPARLNPRLMRGHMPKKYWRNMPESRDIPALVAAAAPRAEAMLAAEPTEPARKGRVVLLPHAQHRASGPLARGPPASKPPARRPPAAAPARLWEPATQTVFGEGPRTAPVMLVGEQPGDWEDLEGRPFVGPAGQLLDRALWRKPASTARPSTSPMPSSISSSRSAASAASTSAPTRARSSTAASGSSSSASW